MDDLSGRTPSVNAPTVAECEAQKTLFFDQWEEASGVPKDWLIRLARNHRALIPMETLWREQNKDFIVEFEAVCFSGGLPDGRNVQTALPPSSSTLTEGRPNRFRSGRRRTLDPPLPATPPFPTET